MKRKLYRFDLVLTLFEIVPSSISKDNLTLTNGGEQLLEKVFMGKDGRLHVASKLPYVENDQYRLILHKSAKMTDGSNLPEDVIVPFRIVEGKVILTIDKSNMRYINSKVATAKDAKSKRIRAWGYFIAGVLTMALVYTIMTNRVGGLIVGTDVATSALMSGTSYKIAAGAILISEERTVERRDVRIVHLSPLKTAKLHIWDYADEDGDTVRVYVNDTPITREIEITNTPFTVEIPATGTIEVRSVYDGGGGVTYAVFCDANGTTYLNSAEVGGGNRYTFERNAVLQSIFG